VLINLAMPNKVFQMCLGWQTRPEGRARCCSSSNVQIFTECTNNFKRAVDSVTSGCFSSQSHLGISEQHSGDAPPKQTYTLTVKNWGGGSRGDLECAQVLVKHRRRFAVHHPAGRPHYGAAKGLPDALVAHAHAEQREVGPQLLHGFQGNARVLWFACKAMQRSSTFWLEIVSRCAW